MICRIHRLLLCCILLLGVVNISFASELTDAIDRILKSYGKNLNIGIRIQDMADGNIAYEVNPNRLLTPASTFKLFTSVASLLYFGPSYRFLTHVSTDAKNIQQGMIKGNLYFKFSGDPSLTYNDLENMVIGLSERGITTVQGNIYLDDTAFKKSNIGLGWMSKDLARCYSAPVNAMNLDHNCLSFKLKPANQIGHIADIEPKQLSIFTPIQNNVVTKGNGTRSCGVRISSNNKNIYTLKGCVNDKSRGQKIEIAISDVDRYVTDMLAFALHQHRIRVTGHIGDIAKVKKKNRIIVRHYSAPLWQLNGKMIKNSDNLYAESFLKNLGAHYFKTRGDWDNGAQALSRILKDMAHVNMATARLVGGSGLSRYALVTPKQMSELLYFAYRNFFIEPELMMALPIAGQDGTLQRRLKDSVVLGKIRAKTGTMVGVSSLSGYVFTNKKHLLSFVIIVNGFSDSVRRYTQLEDDICRKLVQLG